MDAEEAIRQIREIHQPRQASWSTYPEHKVCTCNVMYPCKTVRILNAVSDVRS